MKIKFISILLTTIIFALTLPFNIAAVPSLKDYSKDERLVENMPVYRQVSFNKDIELTNEEMLTAAKEWYTDLADSGYLDKPVVSDALREYDISSVDGFAMYLLGRGYGIADIGGTIESEDRLAYYLDSAVRAGAVDLTDNDILLSGARSRAIFS